jgi:hypothetical protein
MAAAMKAMKAQKLRSIKNPDETIVKVKAPKAKAKAVSMKAMQAMKAMKAMKAPKAKAEAVPLRVSRLEGQMAVMRQAVMECDERLANVERRRTIMGDCERALFTPHARPCGSSSD